MNRGIAKRTLFETRSDIRFFLSRVAECVHRGILEVHSFTVLTTHFHMLVRSPKGKLSKAMQKIQNEYSRAFNRKRRRDGTLVRGRFRSKRVDGDRYRKILVRYIDFNPVQAGLVSDPGLFPHGSARFYRKWKGPPWMSRSWVEEFVCSMTEKARYRPEDYSFVFGDPLSPPLRRLVARRLTLARSEPDPLDHLISAAPRQVLAWMQRKAFLADGTRPGIPVCDPQSVGRATRIQQEAIGPWSVAKSRKKGGAWRQAEAGLLRDLCGATYREIAARIGCTESSAHGLIRQHCTLCKEDEEYAAQLAILAKKALAECHGLDPG